MKTKAILVTIYLICIISNSKINGQTADPLANANTKCVLNYFSSLSAVNQVLSGQWMNHRGLPETPQSEYDTSITSIYNSTNKWLSIAGTDYMREHSNPYYKAIENLKSVNQPLINHSRQNGIIMVMVSFKNPWTGSSNTGDMTGSSNLLDIVTPGHPANTFFIKELDSIAVGFSQLQDSGVCVIFRPFQEMNAPWFWWGSKTSTLPVNSDFATLWQFTFDYLTNTKGLHNILWYFAPSCKESNMNNPSFKNETFYYPGDNYVDLVGVDIYNDTLDIPNYAELVTLGKPIGIAEFGPKKSTVQNLKNVYDYTILINQIKTKYPLLNHFVSWNHFYNGTQWTYYSLATQKNVDLLLNDSWVTNRDEIDYTLCNTTSINENVAKEIFSIFPNPVDSKLYFSNFLEQFTITNSLGQKITTGSGKFISTTELKNGIYFLNAEKINLRYIVQH